jgi:class 3 adenylate cyclase
VRIRPWRVLVNTRPEIRYARRGDVHLAYTVIGDGPIDLVIVPGFISHLEIGMEEPSVVRFLRRLRSFSRVILFDKRGTGLSDRLGADNFTDPVDLADDVAAVMDAAGIDRAAVFGVSEGGSMAIRLAAEHPERVSALITYGCWAKAVRSEDFPHGPTREQFFKFWESALAHWGDGEALRLWAPSRGDDMQLRDWWARLERHAASPGVVMAIGHADADLDVRPYLPQIDVPTLVLHRRGDRLVTIDQAHFLAEHIAQAEFVELDGEDHLFFVGEVDPMIDAIETFLTGAARSASAERQVATLLFSDIVGSTGRASEVGDSRWGEMIDAHDRNAEVIVVRAGGAVVRTTGDGLLATFSTPSAAVRAAAEMRAEMRSAGLDVRIGMHSGEIERRGNDVGGLGVHIAARVAAMAEPGEILVSRTVVDLVVGSGVAFEPRGRHELRGVPGKWDLAALTAVEG